MERTILLVDDERDIGAALARLLRSDGYKILHATSGKEGLALLAEHEIGVVISDQRMPEMTGVEFLTQVKECYPNTTRIVLSGYADLDAVMDAINRGSIYKFFTKPWDNEILRAEVLEAFRHRELLAEKNLLLQDIERIKHFAYFDALTDLPNRMLFSDRLQQALVSAKREKVRAALMFLDLDKFKPINDTFGHHIGDLLLKETAKRMQSCVRESDTVARIGGDEFVVLLTTTDTAKDALLVAKKILDALRLPFVIEQHQLQISCSIGVAIYPEHGSNEITLSDNADAAMYYAKAHGRDTVKLYQPEMRTPNKSEPCD